MHSVCMFPLDLEPVPFIYSTTQDIYMWLTLCYALVWVGIKSYPPGQNDHHLADDILGFIIVFVLSVD